MFDDYEDKCVSDFVKLHLVDSNLKLLAKTNCIAAILQLENGCRIEMTSGNSYVVVEDYDSVSNKIQ